MPFLGYCSSAAPQRPVQGVLQFRAAAHLGINSAPETGEMPNSNLGLCHHILLNIVSVASMCDRFCNSLTIRWETPAILVSNQKYKLFIQVTTCQ
jgi:hypothetical protein